MKPQSKDLIKKFNLMQTYWSLSMKERDWWFKSLPLEDRKLIREELDSNPQKLF